MNMNFTMVPVELSCVENLKNDILHSARLGMGSSSLTHWGLVAPYGVGDLGQHWFRQWFVAWRHQAIT